MPIDRRYVLNPDAWDPRTVSSIGSNVDVTTLDGLADQLIGPTAGKVVRLTTSVVEFGVHRDRAHGLAGDRHPGEHRLHGAGPRLDRRLARGDRAVRHLVDHPARDAGAPVVDALPGRRACARRPGPFVVLAWSLALGSWLVLADPSTATSDEVELLDLINGIIRVSIAIAIVITALSGALELRRFRQLAPPSSRRRRRRTTLGRPDPGRQRRGGRSASLVSVTVPPRTVVTACSADNGPTWQARLVGMSGPIRGSLAVMATGPPPMSAPLVRAGRRRCGS